MEDEILVVVTMVAVFALIVLFVVFAMLVRPWLRAALHSVPVPLLRIIGMRLRGNRPRLLIDAYISLSRAGVSTTIGQVENVYIDGRNRVTTSDDLVELVKQRVGHAGDQRY